MLTAIKDVVTSRRRGDVDGAVRSPGANVQLQQGGMGTGGILGKLGGILGVGAVRFSRAARLAVRHRSFRLAVPVPVLVLGGGLGSITASDLRFGAEAFVPRRGSRRDTTVRAIFVRWRRRWHGRCACGRRNLLEGRAGWHACQVSNRFSDSARTPGPIWAAAGWPLAGWISQYGSFGDKLQASAKSNAALMAGGLLAMDGLRRGGYHRPCGDHSGRCADRVQHSAVPLGAAIGAAAGAVAGIVRLFVKGAVEKAKDKIKALYESIFPTRVCCSSIVEMAKSGFGGNLDMAIRSPQIRDLIERSAPGQFPGNVPRGPSLTTRETPADLPAM